MKEHKKIKDKYLMVFNEPTSFILDLIKEIRGNMEEQVDVTFIGENSSQNWDLPVRDLRVEILPENLCLALIALYHKISNSRYKLIHLSGWGGRLLFVLVICWLYHIPVVMTSDTTLRKILPLWKTFIKAIFYPLLFRIPKFLLPAGSRQAEYFRYYGVKDTRIQVAKMTVDVAGFMKRCSELGEKGRNTTRANLGFFESDIIFIFVGRLVEIKGIRNLLSSFDRLSVRYSNTRLLFVGEGPLYDEIIKASEKNHSIKYTGRLDQDGVIEMLHASDVAVLTSVQEQWGIVVNEAMSAGLPIIATDMVGCVDDLIFDGVTGRVVEADNPLALTSAMQEMVLDKNNRIRMANAAFCLISGWKLNNYAKIIKGSWFKSIDR